MDTASDYTEQGWKDLSYTLYSEQDKLKDVHTTISLTYITKYLLIRDVNLLTFERCRMADCVQTNCWICTTIELMTLLTSDIYAPTELKDPQKRAHYTSWQRIDRRYILAILFANCALGGTKVENQEQLMQNVQQSCETYSTLRLGLADACTLPSHMPKKNPCIHLFFASKFKFKSCNNAVLSEYFVINLVQQSLTALGALDYADDTTTITYPTKR
jgi:hypothetical protein